MAKSKSNATVTITMTDPLLLLVVSPLMTDSFAGRFAQNTTKFRNAAP
jgi:hypothetical protein